MSDVDLNSKVVNSDGEEPSWDDMPPARGILGQTAVLAIVTVPSIAWMSLVASILWSWFAEPRGAPRMGVGDAFAVRMFIAAFGLFRPPGKDRDRLTQLTINALLFERWDRFFRVCALKLLTAFLFGATLLGLAWVALFA